MLMVAAFLNAYLLTIDGNVPAVEPARAAVARLGAALGRPVEIARDLGAVPVLVDAPGIAPDAALRALALALHASLVRDGKTLRLERGAADRRMVREAHLAANRDRVVDGLARWDRILRRADKFGDAAAGVRAARAEVDGAHQNAESTRAGHKIYVPPADLLDPFVIEPIGRLLRGLLTRLGPDRLAAIEPGEVRFFSDRPNAAESPLPACADLIAAYMAMEEGYAASMGLPAPTGPPAKVIIRADEKGSRIDAYDSRGKRLNFLYRFYALGPILFDRSAPPADLTPRWVERDERSRRMTTVLAGSPDPLRPEELPEAVLHPERSDPLGFDVRTALLALSRPKDAPALVAVLDDRLSGLAWESVQGGRLDAAAFEWKLLSERGGYERLNRDGMSFVRPRDALGAEVGLADREALGRELRRVVAARDYGFRSRCFLNAALYKRQWGFAADAGYGWTLNRMFGPVVNDPPAGAMALGGAMLQTGTTETDATAPSFAELVRDGTSRGWLRFDGPPGTSDLDRAPSTVLAALGHARIACATTELPVAMRYGGMTEAEVRKGFGGEDPETLGAGVAEMIVNSAIPEARKRRFIQSLLEDVRYFVGRRRTDTVEVRLKNGLRAHLEFPAQIAERGNLTFADLPASMREGILRGVQKCLDNPPKPGTGMVLPTNAIPAKP